MGLEKLGLKEGDVVRLNAFDREIKSKLIEIDSKYERFILIARHEEEGKGIFHYYLPFFYTKKDKEITTPIWKRISHFFYTKKNKKIITSAFIARGYVHVVEDIYPKLDRELKDVSL